MDPKNDVVSHRNLRDFQGVNPCSGAKSRFFFVLKIRFMADICTAINPKREFMKPWASKSIPSNGPRSMEFPGSL